jgi:Holliday junction resolvase-like predicted endonuclease
MLALLKLPENTRTPEELFSERYGLPEERTRQELREAVQLGLVHIIDKCLQVSQVERLKLVLRCLEDGLAVERVCQAAGWREFEDLAAVILGSNGYVTKKHLRFRVGAKGYEVDVLALRTPWSLVVECKRWKRSWQPSALRRVADTHRRKASALAEALPSLSDGLDRSMHRDKKLVPVVLTLSDTPMKMKSGVPFVPISRFQSFLEEFAGYVGDLAVFSSPPKESP